MAIHLEQILYIGLGTAVAQMMIGGNETGRAKTKQKTKKQWRIYGQTEMAVNNKGNRISNTCSREGKKIPHSIPGFGRKQPREPKSEF